MTIDLTRIKSYAPKARRDFIAAVANRAAKFGITESGNLEARVTGDVVIIGGQAYPKSVGQQREQLIGRIAKEGYQEVIEQVAYTWFNRLAALRFLEVNDYLGHPFLVLSARPNPNGIQDPEILKYAEELEFKGLDIDVIKSLMIDGSRDEEIYRLILVTQCNALHSRMPFLFERIGDETELLLPDGLLATDGLIRKLVTAIPKNDWKNIEIIGWLYQSYISEKKDQVFFDLKKNSKKISPESIPAATQIFTPRWIVQYLLDNSLGRLWLLNNPRSSLADKMKYYVENLEDGSGFPHVSNPEYIRICDPACGSGHMLTYAFDLMYEIYEENGYNTQEIPQLILDNNLIGIEIDERAGALAAFALAMKAAAKLGTRRFLKASLKPNIVVLQNIDFSDNEITTIDYVVKQKLSGTYLKETLRQFGQAKNYGSLIVPSLNDPNEALQAVESWDCGGDLLLQNLKERVVKTINMSTALSRKYDVVVANPPYAGIKGLNLELKKWIEVKYPNSKTDLMTCFMERAATLTKTTSFWGMINLPGWLFQSSHESLRKSIFSSSSITSMLHLGRGLFGADFGAVAFIVHNRRASTKGVYRRLFDRHVEVRSPEEIEARFFDASDVVYHAGPEDFEIIPGAPVAYWLSDRFRKIFADAPPVAERFTACQGLSTSSSPTFVRNWFEVQAGKTSFPGRGISNNGRKWIPYNKGGEFRKWSGNREYVVDWEDGGRAIKSLRPKSVVRNESRYFEKSVSWSDVTAARSSFRLYEEGFIFANNAHSAFPKTGASLEALIALLNSKVADGIVNAISPGMHFDVGYFSKIPLQNIDASADVEWMISTARSDWDLRETSWDFASHPLVSPNREDTVEATYRSVRSDWQKITNEMQRLEEANNRTFIGAYALQDEIAPEVPIDEITLTCNPAYRYGSKLSAAIAETRLLEDTIKELISYSIGCSMGRYSLSKPGLVYAETGGEGFDGSVYGRFSADEDGIIPVTYRHWFDDDATMRFAEFLKIVWGEKTVEINLRFIADNLSPKRGEASIDTIRRYVSRSFFDAHLQTYNRRPIYWLFSSGPERAFECLVYLHRYNDKTLARMRTKYVTPLQTRIQNRLDSLKLAGGDSRSSTVEKSRLREVDTLQRQLHELSEFDDRLRQAMDRNIKLDLDDGVRANYMKLRELLADADVVIGKKGDGDDE